MDKRLSGILLHISSLPSTGGIGDLGPWAYRFADWLHQAHQSIWQVLPLNPTDPVSGNSPYSSISAMAGNPLFISPEFLVAWGLLEKEVLEEAQDFPLDECSYEKVIPWKKGLLERAFRRFGKGHLLWEEYQQFCQTEKWWLDDHALFVAIKNQQGGKPWVFWPKGLRERDPVFLEKARTDLAWEADKERFAQFVFFHQWGDLKKYCNGLGIMLMGDVPIYVNHDSADVWAGRDLFLLDEDGFPTVVSGVPPDYFSPTGQRWGNPIYNWSVMERDGFAWWIRRVGQNLRWFDTLRVDHFRGLMAYWEIPAKEDTATLGRWVQAPGERLIETLLTHCPPGTFVAEDLGIITPDVRAVMEKFQIPGMNVLQFAFSGDFPNNPYLPHNHRPNSVVYTGTHDNNTARGWFENEATKEERERVWKYTGRETSAKEIPWEMVRLAMMSVARIAIVPLQDVLGLGQEARMNTPATTQGNWRWRLDPSLLTQKHLEVLRELTQIYGRAPKSNEARVPPGDRGYFRIWPVEVGKGTAGRWPREPVIYEIPALHWLWELSRKYGRRITLDTVPDVEWDLIASKGIDAVWLMGVWERSEVSARMSFEDPWILQNCKALLGEVKLEDMAGSPYSVKRYEVEPRLGGPKGLASARQSLAKRAIRLILDYVPNHVAHDHPWIRENPDYLLQGTKEDLLKDPRGFVGIEGRVFARGRDPFFPPWADTIQVNCFHKGFRDASIRLLKGIANECDGVRCDMAMLMLDKVFKKTWGEKAAHPLEREFWVEVIEAVKRTHREFLFLAEVYWGLEGELLELGFDLCYDKVLYDRLRYDNGGSVSEHLERTSGIGDRLLRFLENHDEDRAATAFPMDRHQAAAFVMAFVPGARLYHYGQLEGRKKYVPIHLARSPLEEPDERLTRWYSRILSLREQVGRHLEGWRFCPVTGWPENHTFRDILSWSWGRARRYVAAVNYSDRRSQAMIWLPWSDLGGKEWRLEDLMSGEVYRRNGSEMYEKGLYIDLGPWGIHLFEISAW